MKFYSIILFSVIIFSSCNKEQDKWYNTPTALKFTDKKEVTENGFKFKYVCLKYNNGWYERINTDGTKKVFTDVLQFDVYSNNNKPLDKWIDYYQWMKDTTVLTFRNVKIDSIPTWYKRIEATDSELKGM